MEQLLWIVVISPFVGALVLAVFGGYMPKKMAGTIGCASVGASWIAAMVLSAIVRRGALDSVLYEWMGVGGLRITIDLRLDALSMVMVGVITFVGFLIHLYAAQSMYDEDGYSRFFAYMNLFVGSMLTLVLAGNLVLLYLGWEGVGLCSYLLIGFWYRDSNNGNAAQKAFIVTRVGDTALAIGLFLIFVRIGSLDIRTITDIARGAWTPGGPVIATIAILIIGGAIGKSAQLPLQTWLPDAMAGPTPVSALIHAATMVTAGVYLIARLHVIFEMSQMAMMVVAVIGAATLVYAGFSALTQRDIKRVLAYSTISQIGYMFLALGVGAWTAAMFHFMTHASFKALLFLSAGIVIDALHHEHDMFRMGGLRNRLPVAYWTFLIGAASLSALPLVTAGFYSKDAILYAAWASESGGTALWAAGIVGALITAAYSFRAVFLTFHGEPKTEVTKPPGSLMELVVIVLAFLALTTGFVGVPRALGGFEPFEELMHSVFPGLQLVPARSGTSVQALLMAISSAVALLGLWMAYIHFRKPALSEAVGRSPVGRATHRFLFVGWGFDWLYDRAFVRPFKAIAFANRADFVDKLYAGLALTAAYLNRALAFAQTGRTRHYATAVVLGAVVLGAIMLLAR